MAISTYQTYLMHSEDGDEYTKLVDIKEFPDLGSPPSTIDATTLTDNQKVYIQDILDPGSQEFNANYDAKMFTKLKALEHKTEHYAIWLGGSGDGQAATPDGHFGKFKFDGQLSVWKKGGSVSAVQDMGIAIAVSSEIIFEEGSV